MQAEVTGKLKQHFNNALPKQNSTTTGVSVIMVSRTGGSALGQLQRLAHCSDRHRILSSQPPGASLTRPWALSCSSPLQEWLGTLRAPFGRLPGLGSWDQRLRRSQQGQADGPLAGASQPLLLGLVASRQLLLSHPCFPV